MNKSNPVIFNFILIVLLNNVTATIPLIAQTHRLPKSAIAYFQFERNVNDESPNRIEVYTQNIEFKKGYSGQGIYLNGNGNVRIPHSSLLNFDNVMTFDAWVWATQRYVEGCRLFELDDEIITLSLNHMGSLDFTYKPKNGSVQMLRSNGDNGVLYMDRWMHVSAVLGEGLMLLFIDGKEVGRKIIPTHLREIAKTNGDFFLGNCRKGNRGYYGYMDEVRISRDMSPSVSPLVIDILPYPSQGILEITANIIGLKTKEGNTRAIARIFPAGREEIVQSVSLESFEHSIAKGHFNLNALAPGEYKIDVIVSGAGSDSTLHASEKFTKTGNPVWLNTSMTLREDVPVPFTPVEVKENTLSCWGRNYIYSPASVFPSNITSLDSSVLAGPIRLEGKIDKRSIVWKPGSNTITQISPAKAEVASVSESGDLSLKVASTLEFDGMLRMDLSLKPLHSLVIDTLYLDIPLQKSIAKYYIYYPEKWAIGVPNAGSIPTEGWQSIFKPYLWIGNDDRGICWFAESTKGWSLLPAEPVLKILPRKDDMLLRISIVNKPHALEHILNLTFGLQASPVKPLPQGRRQWRYGFDVPGDNVVVFWADPHYSKWYTFPQPLNSDSFWAKIDDIHKRGKKVTFYSSLYYLSSVAPEWKYYKGDWWSHGVVFGQSDIVPFGHLSMPVCPAQKNYKDFILYQYKQFFEKYDTDGMYFDNGPLNTCQNPLHTECSFINSNDKTEYVYQWFAIREIKKNIYTMMKQKKSDGIIVFHLSMSPLLPLASFCDAYVDGEQFIFEGFTGDYLGTTSPDKVRAELTGRQFGLVSFFLPEIIGDYVKQDEPTENLMAMVLLHDMNLWMHFCNKEVVNRAWNAVDKFGITDAEFYPYWNSVRCAESSDDNIKISAYYKSGKEALLVVVNMSDAPKAAHFQINRKIFGFNYAETLNVRDGFSGETIQVDGNSITLDIKRKNYRLCHIFRK